MDLKQKNLAKTIGLVIGIALFALAIAGVTYAFYRWRSSNINIAGESACFTIDYTKGPNIENESVILFDESTIINNNQITIKNGMALTGLTAGNSTCETPVELTVNLTINSLNNAFITGNSIGAFKYIVANYDPASYQTISTTSLIGETFDIIKSGSITSTDPITLITEVLTATQKGYLVIFYVDGDLANNDASNSSFSATISAEASQYIKPTLATHITNLYLDNKDAQPVENNGILYRYASIYDKDEDEKTSGGLMNDRHGSMDTGEDEGNIRYYGANPNNYIYFNCSDYSNQSESTCEVWRIIGVFDGKVKLMRNSVFTKNLSWDQNKNNLNGTSTDTSYNNDWSTSSLQEFLNGKYYDRGEDTTYTYYNGSTGSSSVSINLESIGIKNDETRRLISETLWYLKGWDDPEIYSDQMYDYERNSGKVYPIRWPTTMPGKIAIPYASDYGYAVDFGSCSKTLYDYNDTTCTSANWMKSTFGTSYVWLITPFSLSSSDVWDVNGSGRVRYNEGIVSNTLSVAPVLHLNSELGIKTGDGSSGNPYKLEVKTENKEQNFVQYLTNKYTSANPTQATVANNGINYYYAPSVSMMNDGMGSNHTWEDGANAGNIRYYGKTPNNYIDIGDTYTVDTVINNYEKNKDFLSLDLGLEDSNACYDYFDCSNNYSAIGEILGFDFDNEEACVFGLKNYYHVENLNEMCGTETKKAGDPKLYRIIGLFKNVELEDGTKKDLIKVIRDEPIGNFAFDLNEVDLDLSENNWHNSTLQPILNNAFYKSLSATHSYFDWHTGDFIENSTTNFAINGLNSAVQNKIATVKWNLGGISSPVVYADQLYKYEKVGETCENCTSKQAWSGKIALMYPSDYGYAVDFSSCNGTVSSYDENVVDCIITNWIFSLSNGNQGEWLLSPNAEVYYNNLYLCFGGLIEYSVDNAMAVRPTFYLTPELNIVSGDGSQTNPYKLSN